MGSSFIRPGADASRERREHGAAPRRGWRTWLFGRPLPTADAPHEAIGKAVGLAVFSSDALSSTAYATQEIMVILAMAGTAALSFVVPISVAIVLLLAIVTFSYEQTIHAYPDGGGAYIVARDNLGEFPAQVAGGALLMDYILTVAVSVSSAVAQVSSAFPAAHGHRVALAVALVAFAMMVNLRGVKESGAVFAVPTFFFVVTMALTVGTALARHLLGTLQPLPDPPPLEIEPTRAIGLFLVLHAFSSGTTALTGVEAISNGIPAFKEPRSRNAGITLLWMSGILAVLFLGISFLAGPIGAVPSERETVISQLARAAFGGRGSLYLATIGATTLILAMAANTAYAGFPRLAALQAADGYLPRQLTYRGSRLVFSRGIALLALVASRPHLGLRRQRHRPDPALRDRRLPVVHALAGGDGAPLVEGGPAPAGRGGEGARRRSLRHDRRWLAQDGRQRARGRPHCDRHARLRGDEVPRRRLGGADRDPRSWSCSSTRSTATTGSSPGSCRSSASAPRRGWTATGSSCRSAGSTAGWWRASPTRGRSRRT